MTVYIYTLKDPITNEIRYVGQSVNPKKRLTNHKTVNNHRYSGNWIKALKRQKLSPIMEIIEAVNIKDASWTETYWISQFKTWGFKLTNHLENSGFNYNYIKGRSPWNKGKKLSEDIKQKMSLALRDHSWKIGRKRNPESIRKSVLKRSGALNTNAKLTNEQVLDIRTSSLTNVTLAKNHGISLRQIYRVKARETYNT